MRNILKEKDKSPSTGLQEREKTRKPKKEKKKKCPGKKQKWKYSKAQEELWTAGKELEKQGEHYTNEEWGWRKSLKESRDTRSQQEMNCGFGRSESYMCPKRDPWQGGQVSGDTKWMS